MSTGAGASLELVEGTVLPDIAPLSHSGAAPALQSSKKLQLIDPDVKGKRMFIRVDFNVPNASTAWTRVSCLLPIWVALTATRCLRSSLWPPLPRKALEGLTNKPVTFLKDTLGPEVEAACAAPADGSVILLENTRFYADEEDRGVDDGEKFNASAQEIAAFRGSLGKLADIYVSDA